MKPRQQLTPDQKAKLRAVLGDRGIRRYVAAGLARRLGPRFACVFAAGVILGGLAVGLVLR